LGPLNPPLRRPYSTSFSFTIVAKYSQFNPYIKIKKKFTTGSKSR